MSELGRRRFTLLTVIGMIACGAAEESLPPDAPPAASCSCEGAVCGVDNCGQPCGTCAEGTLCLGGACEDEESCDVIGFKSSVVEAVSRTTKSEHRIRYTATTNQGQPPYDRLAFELITDETRKGPSEPGLYDLANSGAQDCALCVSTEKECDEAGACIRAFAPEAGSLYLSEIGDQDGALVGAIHGLKLREVYRDPKTGERYALPHGKVWCIPEHQFDQDMNEIEIVGDCVAQGTGNALGDKIANITLVNCHGEKVPLHDACGVTSAVWFIAVAGW